MENTTKLVNIIINKIESDYIETYDELYNEFWYQVNKLNINLTQDEGDTIIKKFCISYHIKYELNNFLDINEEEIIEFNNIEKELLENYYYDITAYELNEFLKSFVDNYDDNYYNKIYQYLIKNNWNIYDESSDNEEDWEENLNY